ncbi:immunoglobulin lambda-1 light chain-like [Xyrichtys novacula]|nr:immunoglobulin lambda-1 light chain-like [Xyrichtys novacula]
MILLLCLTSCVLTVSGFSSSKVVTQTPSNIYTKLSDPASVDCKHELQHFDRILWYKQLENKQMQFLGYMGAMFGYPEDETKVKIQGNAKANQKCTLRILKVDLNSSAVYFCAAAYHTAAPRCSVTQKPPLYLKEISHSLLLPLGVITTALMNANMRVRMRGGGNIYDTSHVPLSVRKSPRLQTTFTENQEKLQNLTAAMKLTTITSSFGINSQMDS